MIIIAGLGNPGSEYEETRHNAGRNAAMRAAHIFHFPDFSFYKKADALISKGEIGKKEVSIVLPETFMNKSGSAFIKLIKPKKELRKLIVIHDDLDIPLGKIKISYGKNSGGHKGVESVMRSLKTKNFVRIRIGISPPARGGSALGRKPDQQKLIRFIVGKFTPKEKPLMTKVNKKVSETLALMVSESLEYAMNNLKQ